VTAIVGRIVHNWPLKLAAVGLATLLYGGLALSTNTQSYPGDIPVHPINEPPDIFVLSPPAHVTQVRYFAPSGVSVAASTFIATIDLADYGDAVGVVSVPIEVSTPDARIRILGFEPAFATIELDTLMSIDGVPVQVAHGDVPDGLTLGQTTIEPETVTISGAATLVSQVEAVRADVIIGSGGIDVDEDAALTPIDKLGDPVRPVEVSPSSARVRIQVFSNKQSRSLPVNPIVTGNPAAGFAVASLTVDPSVILVAGDADQLAELTSIDTKPISLTGISADETVEVELALPDEVAAVDRTTVTVAITVRQVTATRTYDTGLRLVGADSNLTYSLSIDRVLATIGGSTADLDRLEGSSLVLDLDVAGLTPGEHEVEVTADLPIGLTLVAVSPPTVTVTIVEPTPSASPAGIVGPSASPIGG
jgi:YbbR domain-containing protein